MAKLQQYKTFNSLRGGGGAGGEGVQGELCMYIEGKYKRMYFSIMSNTIQYSTVQQGIRRPFMHRNSTTTDLFI
jgi:hypothetical protein